MSLDLARTCLLLAIGPEHRVVGYVPCENVLSMVVPQIDRRRSPNWYTLRFTLIIREQIRRYCFIRYPHSNNSIPEYALTHRLLHPHSLTPSILGHLLNTWEKPLSFLRLILRRKHISLWRYPQETFNHDFAFW
jgi:hypothetical protein